MTWHPVREPGGHSLKQIQGKEAYNWMRNRGRYPFYQSWCVTPMPTVDAPNVPWHQPNSALTASEVAAHYDEQSARLYIAESRRRLT